MRFIVPLAQVAILQGVHAYIYLTEIDCLNKSMCVCLCVRACVRACVCLCRTYVYLHFLHTENQTLHLLESVDIL